MLANFPTCLTPSQPYCPQSAPSSSFSFSTPLLFYHHFTIFPPSLCEFQCFHWTILFIEFYMVRFYLFLSLSPSLFSQTLCCVSQELMLCESLYCVNIFSYIPLSLSLSVFLSSFCSHTMSHFSFSYSLFNFLIFSTSFPSSLWSFILFLITLFTVLSRSARSIAMSKMC